MRSDDLVPLLAPPVNNGVGFRQGVILTWDANTAENTVIVDQQVFTNLPILNTSEASILDVGDVVGILTAGQTWGILGRFTIPGTPEAASSLSALRTQSANVDAVQTTTSAAYTDLSTVGPAVTINVGPSGRVLVLVSARFTAEAPRGSTLNTGGAYMSYAVSGANSSAAADIYSASQEIQYDNVSASFITTLRVFGGLTRATLRTGLAEGDTTFTAKYRRDTAGTATFEYRNITVMAL